jgi:hypothetical protein
MTKLNRIISHLTKITTAFILLGLLIVSSCKEDEKPLQTATVQFAASAQVVSESGAAITVTINLDKAAGKDGTITVGLAGTAEYTTNYTTNPAGTTGTINVAVTGGQTVAQFTVTPVNNALLDGDKTIEVTLIDASDAFEIGSQDTNVITITDDEGPTQANFELVESSIAENVAEGIDVTINLSSPALGTGSITVSLTSTTVVYATDFTTEPVATASQLVVPVTENATSVSFKVIPVDDEDLNDLREIVFTLTSADGVVVVGSAITEHEVTITDNDDAIATIADVRAMYSGSNVDISNSLRIQGIVTSINDNINANNIWVQDATGGIVVRFVSANSNTIARGDEVIVQLNGGQLTEFSGLRQVQNVPNANATIVDNNNTLPTPEVVTVTQFLTGDYEGKLVRINSVIFTEADGVVTMSGNRAISDGSSTTVRTESSASFSSQIVPLGSGTVTGLAGDFTTGPQLIPQVFADDIFANNPVGTIDVTQSLTDFGSVDNGAESASQQYTVQGTTLTADLVVTASAGFKVSTDDINFGATATILAANANSPNAIYVRFAPTTGINQAVNGTITNKSIGAVLQSFDVSGTESGNAASSLLLTENFDYTLSDLLTAHGWSAHSGAGTQSITVTSGLSYTNYPGSGVGGAALVDNNGEDVNKTFTALTSGTIYFSALINVTNVVDGYFLHLGTGASTFGSRVFMKPSATTGKVNFGFAYQSTATYATIPTDFDLNTTYLVIVKYDFDGGSGSLWVVPSGVPATEASVGTAEVVSSGTKLTTIDAIYLRQYNASENVTVDGIRVATVWEDLFN